MATKARVSPLAPTVDAAFREQLLRTVPCRMVLLGGRIER